MSINQYDGLSVFIKIWRLHEQYSYCLFQKEFARPSNAASLSWRVVEVVFIYNNLGQIDIIYNIQFAKYI